MTMSVKEPFGIDPKEYNRFIGQVEIEDIRLVEARAKDVGLPKPPQSTQIRVSAKARYVNGDGKFDIFHTYLLKVTEPASGRLLATLSVVFACTYTSKLSLSENLFEVFRRTTLLVNTWPYFREFVHTMFARMNWVPVIAPTYKLGVQKTTTR